jgi:GNAT superfamily N-acetyltransferase
MIETIKVFERSSLRKGANLSLSNKLHLHNGILQDHMKFIVQGITTCSNRTIYIYFRNNKPVASAFTFNIGLSYSDGNTPETPSFQVYVKEHFRRNGIGSKLFLFAKEHKKVPRFRVTPWDDSSREFYHKVFSSIGLPQKATGNHFNIF